MACLFGGGDSGNFVLSANYYYDQRASIGWRSLYAGRTDFGETGGRNLCVGFFVLLSRDRNSGFVAGKLCSFFMAGDFSPMVCGCSCYPVLFIKSGRCKKDFESTENYNGGYVMRTVWICFLWGITYITGCLCIFTGRLFAGWGERLF